MRSVVALIALVASFGASAEHVLPRDLPAVVNSWLDDFVSSHRQYRGLPMGGPQPELIEMFHGDLNGDGREDAVLLFPMEVSGSGWHQYIAVFLKRGDVLSFCCSRRVGHQTGTMVEVAQIRAQRLVLSGKRWVAGVDAMCCPSAPWHQALRITKSRNPKLVGTGDP